MSLRVKVGLVLGSLGALVFAVRDSHVVLAIDPVNQGCSQSSTPQNHTSALLQQFATSSNAGVMFDLATSQLKLKKAGGTLTNTSFTAAGVPQYSCVGDFDKDGWQDFVAADATAEHAGFWQNQTGQNIPPGFDWSNANNVVTPKFALPGPAENPTYFHTQATAMNGGGMAACADFNGDGNLDFALIIETGDNGGDATLAKLWKGNGDGSFGLPSNLSVDWANDFAHVYWDSNMIADDYDGDGDQDILFPSRGSAIGTGQVQVFYNDGNTVTPTFVPGPILLSNAGLGSSGITAVQYVDFTGDGFKDLAVCGKGSNLIKIYPGAWGGDFTTSQTLVATAGCAILIAGDINLDGNIDLAYATDGNSGTAKWFAGLGTSTPFQGQTATVIPEELSDSDTGFGINYDNDPDGTMDILLADGNGAGYGISTNRVTSNYVSCGTVTSGALDLGDLQNQEMVVTAAKLTPTQTQPAGTSISYFMSNESPESWQQASSCDGDSYCVSFPKPIGRIVKWRAIMCSNDTQTTTPQIAGVSIGYDYTIAKEHYRSGVVVNDGVAYIGAFHQPGDRGHFYAVNAALTSIYWDAGAKLDARTDDSRQVFTSDISGQTALRFSTANAADPDLMAVLQAATEEEATDIITWQRSPRFGVSTDQIAATRLGAVETSTPAIVGPPGRPSWYFSTTPTERAKLDAFIASYSQRPIVALFGSRDGAVHAVRSVPTDISSSVGGEEAWAFIPAQVAYQLKADKTAGVVTAYPDGSPAVADVKLADNQYHTVAIVGSGNGGRGLFALDITNSIDAAGVVHGPDPLWHIVPGGGAAGQSFAKPAIARVKISGADRFIAILGSGTDFSDSSKGRTIIAVDIRNGEQLWRFQTKCALTSDIVTFETDDEGEPGEPKIDGYIDRAVFADYCGYVYKINPAQELAGSQGNPGWIKSNDFGTINTGAVDGNGDPVLALFSTKMTPGALGQERPIAGTLGVHADSSEKNVLFFGTGGIESYDPSQVNEFYAVYASNGEIRTKRSGACAGGSCEKFYGGVVVSEQQVIFTRAFDPPVSGDTCSFGSSTVEAIELNEANEEFVTDFTSATASATVSALFGDAGAVYFATLSGEVIRVGTPRAAEAGQDSANNVGQGAGDSDNPGTEDAPPVTLMGWRHVR